MAIQSITRWLNSKRTPQSQPIPGTTMVPNSAGGYTFPVDAWARLDRFLMLGTEGGSYYATEQKLTLENVKGLQECLQLDGPRVVRRIVEISTAGRAPKNDAAVFALAVALKKGNEATKRDAKAAVSKVCRIGTHLFGLAEAVEALGGWGRGTRSTFAQWYLGQKPVDLAYGLIKYQSRNGWSNRDLLRLAHPKATDETQNALLHWAVKGWKDIGLDPHPDAALRKVWAFERAKRATAADEIVKLVSDYNLPRECVPTQFLNDVKVWDALLDNGGAGMPLTAMIRNLGKMTAVGLVKPLSAASKRIVEKLEDPAALRKARMHPLSILMAHRTYRLGHGDKGGLKWTPDQSVVSALDGAFYKAFQAVDPTGKRWMLALDVSGSMGMGRLAGSPLTPREASAAMALVTLATEPQTHVVGFTSGPVSPLEIAKGDRLDRVVNYVGGLAFGATDCAAPMVYALQQRLEVDAFVVYTDSETWAGNVQPVQALRDYRKRMGIPAKLIVVGMVSNGFSIADPDDAGMLDVVGFDTATPTVMAEFVR